MYRFGLINHCLYVDKFPPHKPSFPPHPSLTVDSCPIHATPHPLMWWTRLSVNLCCYCVSVRPRAYLRNNKAIVDIRFHPWCDPWWITLSILLRRIPGRVVSTVVFLWCLSCVHVQRQSVLVRRSVRTSYCASAAVSESESEKCVDDKGHPSTAIQVPVSNWFLRKLLSNRCGTTTTTTV